LPSSFKPWLWTRTKDAATWVASSIKNVCV